jgi:TolA-binding protein
MSATHEERAKALGGIARVLDGSTPRERELAARERFLVALNAPRRKRAPRLLAAAALSVLAAVAALLLVRQTATLEYRMTGPLAANGEWLTVRPNSGAALLQFSEGTEIELGPGSKGRVAEVSRRGARVELASGRLQARVVPRPRARWTVSAGPYLIEVTGTAFDVGWSAAGSELELSLHDGSVVVRGPSLKNGVRVGAGQRLIANATTGRVALSSLLATRPTPEATPPASAPSSPAPVRDVPAPATPAPAPTSWSELVAAGNFNAVLAAARARGFEQSLDDSSLKDLTALSDAARYVGNRGLARRALLAQRTRFEGSSAAHAAAFMLGRLADDSGALREARSWYDTYAKETPGGAFAAEAMGRKLVVLVRLGDDDAARALARTYLKRFPRGAHASFATELLDQR